MGSYVDQYDYDEALVQLERLGDSGDNLSFKALYYTLISDYLSQEDGSGKAAVAETQVRQTANDAQSEYQTLAESILAMYRGDDYVRNGEPIVAAKSAVNSAKPLFTLAPNPAQGSLVLTWLDPTAALGSKAVILDITGKQVHTFGVSSPSTLVDVSRLAAGMYFVQVANTQEVQKLVVIK